MFRTCSPCAVTLVFPCYILCDTCLVFCRIGRSYVKVPLFARSNKKIEIQNFFQNYEITRKFPRLFTEFLSLNDVSKCSKWQMQTIFGIYDVLQKLEKTITCFLGMSDHNNIWNSENEPNKSFIVDFNKPQWVYGKKFFFQKRSLAPTLCQ